MTQSVTPSRVPRTANRRQQILESAADKFRRSGYHNVGLNEIADEIGLTGPAIYRHFAGKQDLLQATIEDLVERFVGAYQGSDASLGELLDTLAEVAVERRHASVLWQREARHLPRDKRRELRDRFLVAAEPLRARIALTRPDLSAEDVDLLMWACQSILASVSYHSVKLDAGRLRGFLVQVMVSICQTTRFDEVFPDAGPTHMPVGRLLPASRREAALVAASRLFAARGYTDVSMDDIGAAAGIAGPSLYYHFPSKSAILIVQLSRCLDSMMFDVSAALDLAETPAEAVELLLRAIVRTNIEHGVAMAGLLHEMVNVPAEERQGLRRSQRDYTSEWIAVLTGSRPELDPVEAELIVHTTHSVIGLLARQRQIRLRPNLAGELLTLGRTVLAVDVPVPLPK